MVGSIVVGWVMWLYLALDVAIVGVFQNQPTLGLATPIRADEHRMLEFARVAQRLNGNRGIPALGEAILLYRAARAEPDSRYLREQTYEQFHRALIRRSLEFVGIRAFCAVSRRVPAGKVGQRRRVD